jgi:hypothetical protein
MICEQVKSISDAVILKQTAVDDAKAHVRQLEIELDYAKAQLVKTKQEKKGAGKLCNTWKEMMARFGGPAKRVPPMAGGGVPIMRIDDDATETQWKDCGKMMVTTKNFETQLEQIRLNLKENKQLGFQIF